MSSTVAAPPTVMPDTYRTTTSREVYHVPSNTRPHPREVRYYVNDCRYTCSCPAVRECWHIEAVRWFRWWRAFWPTCSDAVLADSVRTYGLQEAEGRLEGEAVVALDTLHAELAARAGRLTA